jgi:cobaltochelatase CobS
MAKKYMYAKFASKCSVCAEPIARFAPIYHDKDTHKAWHEACDAKREGGSSEPTPPPESKGAESQDNSSASEVPVVPAYVPPKAQFADGVNKGEVLAAIIAEIAQSGVNEAKVREIVQEAIASLPPPGERIVAHTFKVGPLPEVTVKTPHKNLPRLIQMMSAKQANGRRTPVWLVGPTGTGKTEGVAQACDVLGCTFEYIACHETMTKHELYGYLQPDGKPVETPLTRALKVALTGQNAVILLDEVTAAGNAVICANALTSNGHVDLPGVGMVPIPDTLYILVADNTGGKGATAEYNGRQKLDDAFLCRFSFLPWGYDADMERAALQNHPIVGKFQALRAFCGERKLKTHITLRQMQMAAAYLDVGISESDALEYTVLANLSTDSRQAVLDYYSKL